ncbi:MAG: chemotaxis response regulator protein-glutamate methylesterase [Planctomycetaceae bacterium]|nr:chemotaxis response regulator protein-glutamate methylesterase [Planctomycetaceae bacterium]
MIRVLIVDDSAVVRRVFTTALSADPEIEVVGAAPDPYVAREMIARLRPDVLTLDVEMPRMDGITFLGHLMAHHPMPVVVVSSLTKRGSVLALEALDTGAVEVLGKPRAAHSAGELASQLARTVKTASKARVTQRKPSTKPMATRSHSLGQTTNKIIAIGASTGGTRALEDLLSALPSSVPGILVVQHMPETFTKTFAERLDKRCALKVSEALDGAGVLPGTAQIAPGNRHLLLNRNGARYCTKLKDGPRVSRHKPSVDALFRSVARFAGANAIGVLLTGMGSDGAKGLVEMHQQKSRTICQDEKSCVVFGMPKEAIKLGAADDVLHLDDIPARILSLLDEKQDADHGKTRARQTASPTVPE